MIIIKLIKIEPRSTLPSKGTVVVMMITRRMQRIVARLPSHAQVDYSIPIRCKLKMLTQLDWLNSRSGRLRVARNHPGAKRVGRTILYKNINMHIDPGGGGGGSICMTRMLVLLAMIKITTCQTTSIMT